MHHLQSFFAYLLMALVYGSILLHRRQNLHIPWYWYLGLAVADVQANYLIVKAYQYSYITSVTLLDCWTIPWVIILTWFALGTRYSLWQFVGAGTCVAGLGLVLLSDAKSPNVQVASNKPLLGDALVIAGTIFFAFSNVGEEYCVKKTDRVEVVAMLGVFGVLVTAIQMYPFHDFISGDQLGKKTGFAAGCFMYATVTPSVLKLSGATMLNLSLLTSDMWAVAIRIFFYHQKINWLYYLALAVVAIGLIIYSLNESSSDDETSTSTERAIQYEQLANDENSNGAILDWHKRRRQEEDHIC